MALRENFGTNSRLSTVNNGHTRSRSVNQIGNQQQSPITSQPVPQMSTASSSSSASHARSHSVNEIKIVNGSHHQDNVLHQQPTTPSGGISSDRRAPIVMTDDI